MNDVSQYPPSDPYPLQFGIDTGAMTFDEGLCGYLTFQIAGGHATQYMDSNNQVLISFDGSPPEYERVTVVDLEVWHSEEPD